MAVSTAEREGVMMYVVRDREAGNVIAEFETMEEAKKELEQYIAEDKENGYGDTEDFYEIAEVERPIGEEVACRG